MPVVATLVILVVIAAGVLAGWLPAHLVGATVAAVLRLVVHDDREHERAGRIHSRNRNDAY